MPKGTPNDTSIKQKLLHRLKIARGHLDRVIGMVEADEYCIDVLTQSSAVNSAIKEANHLLLQNHLETCVADSIKQGNAEEAISEVMKVVTKS